MMRVMVVAAFASARAGLSAIIADQPDMDALEPASGSEELERLSINSLPHALLYDYDEEDSERVLQFAAQNSIAVVVLGESPDGFHSLLTSNLHGWGYLLKENADREEITGALRAVASGLIVLDRALSASLRNNSSSPASTPLPHSLEPLTPREKEVLQLMALGLSNKQIAERLFLSAHTIKFHVASILSKLNASNRAEAVTLGIKQGEVIL